MLTSRFKYWSFIKDPIWGYIHITYDDKKLIDTYPVQRLRRLKQLSLADIVYPGAVHTRFEHSLGVMHLSTLIARNLPVKLDEDEIYLIRISGLLHDIGHGPFSHLFEFYLDKYMNKNHEDMGEWIIKKSELSDIISSLGYTPEEVIEIALGRGNKYPQFMSQIIRSAIDSDKMDFIRRDNYHTGAGYGSVDIERIAYTLEVIDNYLAVNITALSALETLIIARIKSFESIYYHKTIRAAQLMFVKALEETIKEFGMLSFNSPEEYLKLDDYKLWVLISESKEGSKFIRDLESRNLIKMVYERKAIHKDEFLAKLISNESIRNKTIEAIAEVAGVDSEDVYIDAPTLPSVPYHRSYEYDPMEIPIVSGDKDKKIVRLSEISPIIDVLRGHLNIIRVYTTKENREKVKKACYEILGSPTTTSMIST